MKKYYSVISKFDDHGNANAVLGDTVMADQTENQLWKKIINTSTDHLRDFVKGIEVRL